MKTSGLPACIKSVYSTGEPMNHRFLLGFLIHVTAGKLIISVTLSSSRNSLSSSGRDALCAAGVVAAYSKQRVTGGLSRCIFPQPSRSAGASKSTPTRCLQQSILFHIVRVIYGLRLRLVLGFRRLKYVQHWASGVLANLYPVSTTDTRS